MTRKVLLNMLLLFLSNYLFCQAVDIAPCAILQEAMQSKSSDTLDYYLAMDDTQLRLSDRINLMTFKGLLLVRNQGESRSQRRKSSTDVVDSAYQLFTQALNLVEDENLKIEYRMRRYETLEYLKNGYPTRFEDEKLLKESGYKPDLTGFSLLLTGRYDGQYWLGAEASLFSGLQLPFHLRDGYGNTVKRKNVGASASAFVFSYTRNMESGLSESKFSLLRFEAPIYVDILQFGFVRDSGTSYWFYRPQIGVGYGRFSLSYGYSLFFKKSGRDALNRHSLEFKTKFIF